MNINLRELLFKDYKFRTCDFVKLEVSGIAQFIPDQYLM